MVLWWPDKVRRDGDSPVLLVPIHSSNKYLLLCAGTVLGSVHTSVNKTDHSAYDLEWLVGETAIKRNKESIQFQMVVREKSRTEWRESIKGGDAICNGMVREGFLRR